MAVTGTGTRRAVTDDTILVTYRYRYHLAARAHSGGAPHRSYAIRRHSSARPRHAPVRCRLGGLPASSTSPVIVRWTRWRDAVVTVAMASFLARCRNRSHTQWWAVITFMLRQRLRLTHGVLTQLALIFRGWYTSLRHRPTGFLLARLCSLDILPLSYRACYTTLPSVYARVSERVPPCDSVRGSSVHTDSLLILMSWNHGNWSQLSSRFRAAAQHRGSGPVRFG